jgi:hypothetical protein
MKKKYYPQIYNQTGKFLKEPETETIMDKQLHAVVDRSHRLVHHKDGHTLLFTRKKDGISWLMNQKDIPDDWRLMRVDACIMTI